MQVLSKCSFGLGQGWTDIRLSLSAVGGISGPECSRSPSSLPRQQSAMPSIPPGIRYISKHLPRLLSPALLTYASIHVLQAFDIQLPFPSWIACLLSGPLVLTLIVQRRDWLDARAAAKNGATMGPVLPGWIGGVQMFFVKMIDMYPAEGMSIVLAKDAYTTRVRLLFQNRTITADPHNIKTVLATDFNSFEKGSEFQEVLGPLLGTGVFAADGDMWKFHRAMTRPFFHRERISDFELFDHHAENAIGQFKARLREGHPADFQDMVSRFTMDAATTFLFGTNVNTLEAGLPYPFYAPAAEPAAAGKSHPSSAFAAAFQQAQIIASARNRLGEHWPLQEFWVDTMEEPMSVVRAYLDPILREAIEKKRRSGSFEKADVNGDREVQEGETLLEHLVNYTEDHTILRDEILNITTAGRDTVRISTFSAFPPALTLPIDRVPSDIHGVYACRASRGAFQVAPGDYGQRRPDPSPDLRRLPQHEIPPRGSERDFATISTGSFQRPNCPQTCPVQIESRWPPDSRANWNEGCFHPYRDAPPKGSLGSRCLEIRSSPVLG
ncbi:unnamed protein product [Mycena citricolor]|uniref:Cytochrome P450 n=1 Tax=Mycena citricolor TaxID=2018698 RepID=A0AAD2HGH8_9AGAR|nr:unnamed protein product [Mycena citricolor]